MLAGAGTASTAPIPLAARDCVAAGVRLILGSMVVYTVGHSSHTPEHFLALLREHRIEVLVDTRSSPYSRYSPQFDREPLRNLLTASGFRYVFLGDTVGGRPRDESCYDSDGRVLYGRVASQPEFLAAIERLKQGANEFHIALMCSEEDPAHCHRRLLIARVLLSKVRRSHTFWAMARWPATTTWPPPAASC